MKNLLSTKFSDAKVQYGGRFLHMDPKLDVFFEISHSSGHEVAGIVEIARLRSGCAKSHAISLAETREQATLRF